MFEAPGTDIVDVIITKEVVTDAAPCTYVSQSDADETETSASAATDAETEAAESSAGTARPLKVESANP